MVTSQIPWFACRLPWLQECMAKSCLDCLWIGETRPNGGMRECFESRSHCYKCFLAQYQWCHIRLSLAWFCSGNPRLQGSQFWLSDLYGADSEVLICWCPKQWFVLLRLLSPPESLMILEHLRNTLERWDLNLKGHRRNNVAIQGSLVPA